MPGLLWHWFVVLVLISQSVSFDWRKRPLIFEVIIKMCVWIVVIVLLIFDDVYVLSGTFYFFNHYSFTFLSTVSLQSTFLPLAENVASYFLYVMGRFSFLPTYMNSLLSILIYDGCHSLLILGIYYCRLSGFHNFHEEISCYFWWVFLYMWFLFFFYSFQYMLCILSVLAMIRRGDFYSTWCSVCFYLYVSLSLGKFTSMTLREIWFMSLT